MSDFSKAVAGAMKSAMEIMQRDLRTELAAQGHTGSGKLRDSIQYQITEQPDSVTAIIECEDYGLAIEFGVPANKIPFSPGSGAGHSLYIQGLITHFEQKGLSGREAVSAAFATAHVQKREGMPTAESFRFSSTGARTGFARTTLEKDLALIAKILEQQTGAYLNIQIGNEVSKVEPITIYV